MAAIVEARQNNNRLQSNLWVGAVIPPISTKEKAATGITVVSNQRLSQIVAIRPAINEQKILPRQPQIVAIKRDANKIFISFLLSGPGSGDSKARCMIYLGRHFHQ